MASLKSILVASAIWITVAVILVRMSSVEALAPLAVLTFTLVMAFGGFRHLYAKDAPSSKDVDAIIRHAEETLRLVEADKAGDSHDPA